MEDTKIGLEDEISRMIMAENGCTAHFEYEHDKLNTEIFKNTHTITVTTYNPKSKETFLLKSVTANDYVEGLMKISEYVRNHKIDYDSFTVTWSKKGDSHTRPLAYFYCKDALEALEKFYFNKERDEYIIYDVKMNPKS
jgi:hypothetical protein